MAPPFPDASQPSNITHSGGPIWQSPIKPPTMRRSSTSRSCSLAIFFSDSSLLSERLRSTSSRRPTRLVAAEARGGALEHDHGLLATRPGRRDDAELAHETHRVVVRAVAAHEPVAERPVVHALEHDRLAGGGEAGRVDRAGVRAAHPPGHDRLGALGR